MLEEIKKPLGRWARHKENNVLSITKYYIRLFTNDNPLPAKVMVKIDRDKQILVLEDSEEAHDWKVDGNGRINVRLKDVEFGLYNFERKDNQFIANIKCV